jgi:hypothetical protein
MTFIAVYNGDDEDKRMIEDACEQEEQNAREEMDEDEVWRWLEEGMVFVPSQSKLDNLPEGWSYRWRWMAAGGDQIDVLTVTSPAGSWQDY